MNHKNYFIPILDTLKCFKRNIKFWDNASAQWGKLGHKITYLPFYIKLYKILTLLHIIIAIFCFCPRPSSNQLFYTSHQKPHSVYLTFSFYIPFHGPCRWRGRGIGNGRGQRTPEQHTLCWYLHILIIEFRPRIQSTPSPTHLQPPHLREVRRLRSCLLSGSRMWVQSQINCPIRLLVSLVWRGGDL